MCNVSWMWVCECVCVLFMSHVDRKKHIYSKFTDQYVNEKLKLNDSTRWKDFQTRHTEKEKMTVFMY